MSTDYKSFDCYKFFNIPRTSDPQEIRKAYIKKSKECHPDFGGTNEQQIKVNLAYEILSNPLEREQHDRYWNNLYNAHFTTPNTQKPSSKTQTKTTDKSSIQQLFRRVSNIFEQELNNVKFEKEKWVKAKISNYQERVRKWKKEQEALFQQKILEFEEKLKNLQQKQIRIFNQQVAKYDALYFRNTRLRKNLFYTAIIFTEMAILSIALPFVALFFSLGESVTLLSVAGSIAILAGAIFCWVWYMSTKWLIVGLEKVAITDPKCRNKIRNILSNLTMSD